jgi:hypothetical protein
VRSLPGKGGADGSELPEIKSNTNPKPEREGSKSFLRLCFRLVSTPPGQAFFPVTPEYSV